MKRIYPTGRFTPVNMPRKSASSSDLT